MAKDHHKPQPVLSLRDTAIALWNARQLERQVAEARKRRTDSGDRVLDLPTPMYLRVVPPTDDGDGVA